MPFPAMGYTAQNSRDFLALARMLRNYAERHAGDSNNELFLSTAAVLEGQARLAANAATAAGAVARCGRELQSDVLHHPINVVI